MCEVSEPNGTTTNSLRLCRKIKRRKFHNVCVLAMNVARV